MFLVGYGLEKIDGNTGTITLIPMNPPYAEGGDLCLFNGNILIIRLILMAIFMDRGIAMFSLNDPSNVSLVLQYPNTYYIRGLTATDLCNTLLATSNGTNALYYINISDGSFTPVL